MNKQSWPPPFTVRVSDRARYARLRVSPGGGLEVVLPRALRNASPLAIVERHRSWVEKHLCRFAAPEEAAKPEPPEAVILRGGKIVIPVCYGQPETIFLGNELFLAAARTDAAEVAASLRAFVTARAKETLAAETARLAREHGLEYAGLSFRRQKSRWGSCSAKKCLSLNVCLIFLPKELALFVIRHELAHTKHMNHGEAFWKLLFSMEEKAMALDRRLRAAWRHVPAWMWA